MESQRKRKDLSLKEKIAIFERYDELPKMSQRNAALQLQISQPLLCKILKNRAELEKRRKLNENVNCKRCRGGKDEQVGRALKLWLSNHHERDASISGALLKQKAEELAINMGKTDFVATKGWFSRWKKRENIVYRQTHGEPKDADVPAAEMWIKEDWPKLISIYSPENIYNADETGLYFRALPEHTYLFKNESNKGCTISKECITVLCCVSMTGVKRKLLAIGKSKNPSCFKYVKQLPVDYYANKTAWMTAIIFNDWLLKWDKELTDDILLLIDNCTAHVMNVNLKHINVVFLPANTASLIQPCEQGIIRALKAHYRLEMRSRVLELMEDTGQLSANDVAKKTNLLEALHLLTMSWGRVSPYTIRNCYAQGGLKKGTEMELLEELRCIETDAPSDLNIEDFEEWMKIDENVPITAPMTDTDVCQVVRESNKEQTYEKEYNSEDDEDETGNSAEKPLITSADMRAALGILRDGVQQRSAEFEMQYQYENFINNLLDCSKNKLSSNKDKLVL